VIGAIVLVTVDAARTSIEFGADEVTTMVGCTATESMVSKNGEPGEVCDDAVCRHVYGFAEFANVNDVDEGVEHT